MNLDNFKNKKIGILGLGIEGVALYKFFCDKELELIVYDATPLEELKKKVMGIEGASEIFENSNISWRLGDNYLKDLAKDGLDFIFRSPGISIFNSDLQAASKAGAEISSQIKLFFELCPAKIVGVTGTKGKGTTSSLIKNILVTSGEYRDSDITAEAEQASELSSVYLAGNIGSPAVTLLENIQAKDVVILELSSFQLMDLGRSPAIAVVTNLLIDHLDYHADVAEYQGAKRNILAHQKNGDLAILNLNSTFETDFIKTVPSEIKYFSRDSKAEAYVEGENETARVLLKNGEAVCQSDEIKLFGRHNLENIAAATLVGLALDISLDSIKEAVKNFKGLPHRLEKVGEIQGISFVNDSFATNPEPTMAAIAAFREDKILILGGSSKGADFAPLAKKIVEHQVKGVILIGKEGSRIGEALEEAKYSGIVIRFQESPLEEIVEKCLEIGAAGEVVIFSPACASFDYFKNYKVRGDSFRIAVQQKSKGNING